MTDVANKIHEGALQLMRDPGVRLEHDAIFDLLLKHGAKAGTGAHVVRFPRELVEEKIALCPKEVHFADRQGGGRPVTATSPPHIWSVPGLNILEKGEHRPFTRGDLARMSRLLDQLENVDGVFGFSLDDVPPGARDVVGLRVMAENTGKHIRVLCFTPQGSDMMVEMKKVVGDYPWFSVGFTAHGPLRWTNLALEIFRRSAGAGIPASINGEPMAGVSGPVTLAGAAAVGTAEILAGIVVNQVLEPGRPCIFNLGLAHVFDMKTMIAVTGAPENHLLAKISGLMGRFYNIPSASWVSTEAMVPDSQAALEKAIGFFTHMESGVSNIWSVGQLESELTISPEQAVIDNEIISYAKRYLRGVEVSDETLALEVTRRVGIAGSFLADEHTMDHFRDELYMPGILCRVNRGGWNKKGARRLDQVAEEKAQKLMGNPIDHKLSEGQIRELDSLAERFVKSLSS